MVSFLNVLCHNCQVESELSWRVELECLVHSRGLGVLGHSQEAWGLRYIRLLLVFPKLLVAFLIWSSGRDTSLGIKRILFKTIHTLQWSQPIWENISHCSCFDQICQGLKERRIYLAHGIGGYSPVCWGRHGRIQGHALDSSLLGRPGGKQQECWHSAGSFSPLFIHFMGWYYPHSEWALPPQLNLSGNALKDTPRGTARWLKISSCIYLTTWVQSPENELWLPHMLYSHIQHTCKLIRIEISKNHTWAADIAQRIRLLTAFPEVLSSIPSNYMMAQNHL